MSHHSYFDNAGDDDVQRHQQAQTPSAGPSQAQGHQAGPSADFAAFLQRRDSGQTPPMRTPGGISRANAPKLPRSRSGATPFLADLSLKQGSSSSASDASPQPLHGSFGSSSNGMPPPAAMPSQGARHQMTQEQHHQEHSHANTLRTMSSASLLGGGMSKSPTELPTHQRPESAGQPKQSAQGHASAPSTTQSQAVFQMIHASDIDPVWFSSDNSSTLVLDLRPHSSFSSSSCGRLKGSINLCVPTTLLRRPNYSIHKLADTLPDPAQKEVFKQVISPQTPLKRVIALDTDSVVCPSGSPLASILSKIQRERQAANLTVPELCWVRGGMAAILRESKLQQSSAVVQPGPAEDSDTNEGSRSSSEESVRSCSRSSSDASEQSSTSATSLQSSVPSLKDLAGDKTLSNGDAASDATATPPILQVRSLPMSAFDNTSTQQFKNSSTGDTPGAGPQPNGPLTSRRVAANPFFDAIRQNREIVDLNTSLRNVAPLPLSPSTEQSADMMPPYLQSLVSLSPVERGKRLATEFHELESLEQRRLTDVMQWHSSVPRTDKQSEENPLSISAGVEKGHLNRYRHIFPYEHARCRLERHASHESDYINASHITLRSTDKHYIASQGPVAAATADFWQLIWQEQVSCIVMLTNLKEGGMEKCARYFDDGTYGDLRLSMESSTLPKSCEREAADDTQGSFFSAFDVQRTNNEPQQRPSDRRVLKLERSSGEGRRTVQHFQFSNWPDFDIPPDSETLISFMRDVKEANIKTSRENGFTKPGPLMVHCSAGVGRTGCYMLIDALLDELEHTQQYHDQHGVEKTVDNNMSISARQSANETTKHLDNHSVLDTQETPPLQRANPIFSTVNEMREQRMSMVANLAQYHFVHKALMHGISRSSAQVTTPRAS